MAETALSAFASGELRHQAGPSQPEPAEAAGGRSRTKSCAGSGRRRLPRRSVRFAAFARAVTSSRARRPGARGPCLTRPATAASQPPSRWDVASEALQDVILEGSAQVRSALNVVGMGVQIVAVWFVSTMMMNLRQRCRNGNTAEYGARWTELTDGGSVWVVKSKRGAFHQVNLKKGHASCACRQYVEEGVCPHIKAGGTSKGREAFGGQRAREGSFRTAS